MILDLVQEDETTSDSDKMVLEQLPEKSRNELRTLSEWLCDNKSDDFIAIYANIRSEVLLTSLQNLRSHQRSASGTIAASNHSPIPTRKPIVTKDTPRGKGTPKSIQQAFKKFQNVIPGGEFLGVRSQTLADFREETGMSEREIVSYLTSVSALHKLMQSELKMMEGIIPLQYQKQIFSRLVSSALDIIVKEGDELAARVKRCAARKRFYPSSKLVPHLEAPGFNETLFRTYSRWKLSRSHPQVPGSCDQSPDNYFQGSE